MNKFLWGILAGTKGGKNRARIMDELKTDRTMFISFQKNLNLTTKQLNIILKF